MVFPLYDDNTGRRTFPYVNYALIAINVLVFVVFQRMGPEIGGDEAEQFTYAFACVPYEIVTGKDLDHSVEIENPVTKQSTELKLPPTPVPVYFTLLTSMFLHGGIAHLLGNMLFLWIF